MQTPFAQLVAIAALSVVSVLGSVRLHDDAALVANAFRRDQRSAVSRIPPFTAYDAEGRIVAVQKGQKHLLVLVPQQRNTAEQIDAQVWRTLASAHVAVRAYCLSDLCDASRLEAVGVQVGRHADWRTHRLFDSLFNESVLVLIDEDGLVLRRSSNWDTLHSLQRLQIWLSESPSHR
jgi:hypothetical protein